MNLFQVSLNIVSEDNNTKRRWAQDILFRLHEQSTALSSPLYTP